MITFDLETNGFEEDALNLEEINTIHVLGLHDHDTGRYEIYDTNKGNIQEGIRVLSEADCLCGHNIIFFDMPVLNKLGGGLSFTTNIIDTLVLGRLAFLDVKDFDMALWRRGKMPGKLIGYHSLEAYGYRLEMLKGDFRHEGDFSKWSPEMSEYCLQDVKINVALINKLLAKDIAHEAIQLEHDVAKIIKRQVWHGFEFDIDKAEKFYTTLIEKRENLKKQLRLVFPPWYVKDGKEFLPKKDNKKMGYAAGCPLQKIKLIEFNPSSRFHIAYHLKQRYNWIPVEYGLNGEPKLDDVILGKMAYPEAPMLAEYLTIDKRIGQLAEGKQAWLKVVKKDGRIHGSVNTNGAVTGRMTHHNPNVAQVPKVGNPYGEECRELFTVRKGYKLVGADASGLELRCLAHYLARYDGGAYADTILKSDIHAANQNAAGLPTRDKAKRFIYAYLYGAGNELLGSIIGKGAAAGGRIRKEFQAKTKGMEQLTTAISKAVKTKGYLVGLDGRHLKVRYAYSALNTLLQSAGALVMKRALVILDELLQDAGYVPGIDYEFCANIHDEWQLEVREALADDVGKCAVRAIREAGEAFKFRCPLDGEYKVGDNWANTH